MKTKIIQNTKAIILGLIITVGVGYAAAADWTAPTCTPPGCNAPAPINVSISDQYKEGGLEVGYATLGNLSKTDNLSTSVRFAVPKGTSYFENILSYASIVSNSLKFLPRTGISASADLVNSIEMFSDGQRKLSFYDNVAHENIFSVDTGTIVIKNGSQAANKVLASDEDGRASWKYLDEIPKPCPTCDTVGPGGIQRGRIPVSCVLNGSTKLNWGDSQTDPITITFPKPFSGTPNVVVTLQWAAWTGDEPTSVWVTGIGSTKFVLHIKTPDVPKSCSGEMFAQWIAIGN